MALARITDPITSHDAARDTEHRGVAAAHRQLCLAAVRREPGLTAAEIANRIGLERHKPSRRLPELRDDGLVSNGPVRPCSVQGRNSLTWLPAAPVAEAQS